MIPSIHDVDWEARVLTEDEEEAFIDRACSTGDLDEREALVVLDSHRLLRLEIARLRDDLAAANIRETDARRDHVRAMKRADDFAKAIRETILRLSDIYTSESTLLVVRDILEASIADAKGGKT